MSKNIKKPDMSKKRVEKKKKSIHVSTTTLLNKRHLPGLCYRPLDQRKNSDGDSDAVLLSRKHSFSDGYEMNDLPCTDYERGYMT